MCDFNPGVTTYIRYIADVECSGDDFRSLNCISIPCPVHSISIHYIFTHYLYSKIHSIYCLIYITLFVIVFSEQKIEDISSLGDDTKRSKYIPSSLTECEQGAKGGSQFETRPDHIKSAIDHQITEQTDTPKVKCQPEDDTCREVTEKFAFSEDDTKQTTRSLMVESESIENIATPETDYSNPITEDPKQPTDYSKDSNPKTDASKYMTVEANVSEKYASSNNNEQKEENLSIEVECVDMDCSAEQMQCIVNQCIDGLSMCLGRFSHHYKSLYRLAYVYHHHEPLKVSLLYCY